MGWPIFLSARAAAISASVLLTVQINRRVVEFADIYDGGWPFRLLSSQGLPICAVGAAADRRMAATRAAEPNRSRIFRPVPLRVRLEHVVRAPSPVFPASITTAAASSRTNA